MKIFTAPILFTLLFTTFVHFAFAQNTNIRLNQVGFYPSAQKIAVWVGDKQESFFIISKNTKDTVFKGTLSPQRINAISQKTTQIADFSAFQKLGKYVVSIPNIGNSYPFQIKPNVHRETAIASLKGFYYQRASTALPEKYAGKWHREAGHHDDKILIHPSAATAQRPEGTVISSPRGWYDAGDYNKYIVNSGITMGTLLSLYEDHPDFFKNFEANIPESGNKIPDLLDETLWNLRWMLTMQDPNDGGVYHKLTNPAFDKMVMPNQAKNPRYVIQKNVIASLDFAAVMAQASRILRNHEKVLPKLADSCLNASVKAWNWAKQNPTIVYRQNDMNKAFDPDITTGGYEDRNDADEWIWALAELYITTKDDSYYKAVNLYHEATLQLPTWNQVRMLAYYSLIRNENSLTVLGKNDLPNLRKTIINFADNLLLNTENQAFNTVMGKSAKDYMWGSSSHAANQGIALLQAFQISKDKKYLTGALGNLDYLLGRNATGYSFLTGFGSKQVMFPHHRPSEADGIIEPVPGLLSGGPNPGQQDKCEGYTTKIADESFLDVTCSYSTNEIAINWNAPMVYLAAALEALQGKF
ncbi:glycoside hydrolase family 9 protein [Arcicella sp. LKC2W]|uniref:glycoside hydrolase family 9 protein n=1 Tax=Arcicella sp. LKC2W TaxID=2984198 RepID=UPI002B206665|nr:glycoside hydrolase family 9 protein [Arcicella sp. LKC2W]MEA5461367.1 glycoside hydrolase family 9 protein [Arcicella sp. LKC2W]